MENFYIGQKVYINIDKFYEYAPSAFYREEAWHRSSVEHANSKTPCIVTKIFRNTLKVRDSRGLSMCHAKGVFYTKNEGKLIFNYTESPEPIVFDGFKKWSKRYGK